MPGGGGRERPWRPRPSGGADATGSSTVWDPTMKFWQGRDGRYHAMRGENSRGAKLTEDQVAQIKAAPASGPARVATRALARKFGVTSTTIARIRQGVTWVDVPAARTWNGMNG